MEVSKMWMNEIKLKRSISEELIKSLLCEEDLLHYSLGVIISKLVEQGEKKEVLLEDISSLYDFYVDLKKNV